MPFSILSSRQILFEEPSNLPTKPVILPDFTVGVAVMRKQKKNNEGRMDVHVPDNNIIAIVSKSTPK